VENKPKFILEKVFDLDLNRKLSEIIEDLGEELKAKTKLQVDCRGCEEEEKRIINYNYQKSHGRTTGLCIAAGLLPQDFLYAREIYNQEVAEYGTDYNYEFEGCLTAGALAQYVGVISEKAGLEYKVTGYDSLGLENCLNFAGNEFLGLKMGLLYYLDDIIYQPRKYKVGSCDKILYALVDRGIVKYGRYGAAAETRVGKKYQNISSEYRKKGSEKLKADKLKAELYEILDQILNLEQSQLEELIEANYDVQLIERKMKLIDHYYFYQARTKDKQDNIVNYTFSNNPAAYFVEDIGATYLVDKGLRPQEEFPQELFKLMEKLETEKLELLIESNSDLFAPFCLLEEGGNGSNAVNRLGEKPKVGQITSNLSQDYLRALVKDIILDLHSKEEKIVTKIFKKCRRSASSYLLDLIGDRLRHSMKLKGLLPESELTYESLISRENPDLFTDEDKIYPLDKAALYQIEEQMYYNELLQLWDWKLSGDGIFMILGTELEDDEEPIEYHSFDSEVKFTNQWEEIKLKLEQPSKNTIYGRIKQPSNYSLDRDTEYRHKEEESYNFSPGQGVGFFLTTKQVDPENNLKIDGEDIAKTYKQKDPEEVDLDGRNTSLRNEYYGDNIILRNPRKSMGQLRGDLIYFYGPDKEDKLHIRGFVSGDYGIELKRKAKEQEEEDPPRTYTPHKVRFNRFEFEVLDRLEVKKSLYDHTRIVAAGMIDGDKFQEYKKKLSRSEPKVELNYHDDNRKILFKGYINESELSYDKHEYYLKIEAISYTALLDREPRTRIFQNQGTTYGDVFKVIEDKAKEEYDAKFNIVCDDSSLEDKPLVTEEHPVLLQYRETDWEFLQRICSYLNKPIIIDDMKDTSETLNILVGTHAATAKELNNVTDRKRRKTVEDPETVYNYYQVKRHPHHRSEEIFNLGKPVKYHDSLPEAERAKVKELVLIKNKIYVEQGMLYSDLTLAAEDKINIQRRREKSFVGTAFRAEVKKVNNKHQAQVKFLDYYNQYQEDKAHWYSIDKMHTNAYFAPEVGDVVDVYFGRSEEQYGRVKSSSVVNSEETEHPPEVKRIQVGETKLEIDGEKEKVRAAAGEEEKVYMDVTSEKIELANRDQCLSIESDKIKFENNKSKIELNEDGFIMQSGASKLAIDDEKAELKCGDKGITITDDKITMP